MESIVSGLLLGAGLLLLGILVGYGLGVSKVIVKSEEVAEEK